MTEIPPPPRKESIPENHRGAFARFLGFVEWLGNLLPHPVTLFALFALLVVVLSVLGSWLGLSVENPRPDAEPGDVFTVTNLLSGDGVRWMSTSLVTNFTGFVPLGTVLVALLGVGVAERAGLLSAGIRAMVLSAPPKLVVPVVVFAGVLSNTASEMGYVVLIPLAMVIFHSLGRHPLAGMAAAFAGVSGGYSANLFVGTVDPLLAGITQEAAQIYDPSYEVHPAVNWYFMVASTFLITMLGWFVTARIVEPRLGRYDPEQADDTVEKNPSIEPVSPLEIRGLLWAGASVVVVLMGIFVVAGPRWLPWLDFLPGWGVLRDPSPDVEGPDSFRPLLQSIVTLILVFFILPGIVYGRVVGTIRNDRDVIDAMAGAMRSMGLYIVLVFFAAQFVAFFGHSGLGQILAVLGADLITALKLDNPLVFLPFILMCCFVNLMLGSASAQWAVTAPIFVPMLMQVGYSPEVTQAAYRIGDSTTNIITPMMSYFGLILAVAVRYQRNLGIGTMISTMLPYSIFFLIGWVALFYLWVFVLGLPVGPGAPTHYPG
ncbi:MAG: AbgT family transporter [Phycisphaeraceae bacterium]|nr:MAG: AbgT family transporter [Phycisphaeraceae bacterium]